jgi:hypothetical protein
MGVLLVAGIAVFVGFLLMALIGVGAPSNVSERPPDAAREDSWLSKLDPEKFAKLLRLLFAELKFSVERSEVDGKMIDLYAIDPTPIKGGPIYVRGVLLAPSGMVGEGEVRGGLDTARAEMVRKTIVATSGRFSEDAKAAAAGNAVDLLDGPEILRLTKKHLPEVAAARGL